MTISRNEKGMSLKSSWKQSLQYIWKSHSQTQSYTPKHNGLIQIPWSPMEWLQPVFLAVTAIATSIHHTVRMEQGQIIHNNGSPFYALETAWQQRGPWNNNTSYVVTTTVALFKLKTLRPMTISTSFLSYQVWHVPYRDKTGGNYMASLVHNIPPFNFTEVGWGGGGGGVIIWVQNIRRIYPF